MTDDGRQWLSILVGSAYIAICAFPISAWAEWPERPVKLIVTFAPGSANDAAARMFADALGKKWGKPVIVEDKTGAEGTIGVGSFVSNQDDHTLLYTVGGSITVAPLLVDNLPYDVDRDLVPIAATTAIVLTLAVSSDLPARSISELIDVLRSTRANMHGLPDRPCRDTFLPLF
jgi:tripartite-type tricarboxylate transporter receptor subunit TctC